MFVRLSGGESLIGLPPLIKYPWYDEGEKMQLFPFRTVAMLLSLTSLVLISLLARYIIYFQGTRHWYKMWPIFYSLLFKVLKVPLRYDFFNCFSRRSIYADGKDEEMVSVEQPVKEST